MDEEAFDNLLGQALLGETAAVLAAVAGDQALLHRSSYPLACPHSSALPACSCGPEQVGGAL